MFFVIVQSIQQTSDLISPVKRDTGIFAAPEQPFLALAVPVDRHNLMCRRRRIQRAVLATECCNNAFIVRPEKIVDEITTEAMNVRSDFTPVRAHDHEAHLTIVIAHSRCQILSGRADLEITVQRQLCKFLQRHLGKSPCR